MVIFFLHFMQPFPEKINSYLIFALASVVQFYAGLDFYRSAFGGLKNRIADMNLLVVLGTSAAYFYSTLVLFFPDIFPEKLRQFYFDGAAAIITFVLLGRYLELRARNKASDFMKKLLQLKPQKATVIVDGREVQVSADSLVRGDLVVVRAGEKIPVDGVVVEGEGEVNQQVITGEPIPVLKREGDTVIGGTVLENGYLIIRATKTGRDTLVSQIIALVSQAQEKKPPIGRLADRIVAVFVPAIMVISIVVFDIWYLLDRPDVAFVSAISVLIIACPCALGIATPIAVVSSVGRGAKEGILIKEPSIVEKINGINLMVFDKTGTVTEGKPEVIKKLVYDEKGLEFLYPALKKSNHPVSSAVLKTIPESNKKLERFEIFPGRGFKAVVEGREVVAGSFQFLQENGIKIGSEGQTTAFAVSVDRKVVAVFYLEDRVKPEVKWVFAYLKKKGIKTAILSGDKKEYVERLCRDLGADMCFGQKLPEEKYRLVRSLQKEGYRVAFVGDGVNDAPAMAVSDVGIAVMQATDVAKETGDIILLKKNLKLLIKAITLSEKTLKIIKQNLFWAYFYNVIGIPVAGGILYPITGMVLNPVFAGIAMSVSSVTVVLNALRLQFTRLEDGDDKGDSIG
ncbi:copper-translocating P-type ATPase [Persephonella sp.]